MLDLIYELTALQLFCKDAHYNFVGIDFKPLHEWADEIGEPIDEYLDTLKENGLLFRNLPVPRSIDIIESCKGMIPEDLSSNENILKGIYALLETIHRTINGLEEMTQGDSDIVSTIDAHIQKHIALLHLAGIGK